MPSEFEKQAMEILDEYFKQAGKYPDPEELAHILSVRLGRSVTRGEAQKLIEEHYKEQLLKWAGEELAKYDFMEFYEAVFKVLNGLDMLFYETRNPRWTFRSIELTVILDPILTIARKEGLVDEIEAEALADERRHLMEHPKPFRELMTLEDLDNHMLEVQKGINMLAEYFRGMGENFMAMVVISAYYPAVGIFRSIRRELGL